MRMRGLTWAFVLPGRTIRTVVPLDGCDVEADLPAERRDGLVGDR